MTQSATQRNYEAYRRTSNFGSLDGLRCVSIVAVIWHHSGSHIFNMGFLGVDLFFVISGFLIVTLLLREQSSTGHISLRKFYARRTLRIFPLYYTVILVFAVFYWVVDSRSAYGRHYLHELPYYLTYTANLVPVSFAIVWSLAAEEQFYLLWPSVERYLARFTIPVLAAAIAINQVVNFPAGRNFISNIVGGANWTQLSIAQTTFTPILLGVGAAHLLHSERGYQLLRFMMLSRWASTIYLISLIGLLIIAPVNISGLPRLCMQLVMAALLVSCVYREDHILRSLFRFYPVRRIGQISYGMYLFHIEIIVLVMHFLHIEAQNGSIRLFFIALVFTVIAAEASFRFFETPFLRIKRNFSVVHQAHV